MFSRIILNDMLKSKLTTLITTIFIAIAAMLVALSAILMVNLSGAIDTLMREAKTPHFMQMHAGEIDQTRLEAFASSHDYVEDFQINEFLNIEGAKITINGTSLAHSVQDNGVSKQGQTFDYLLDINGKRIDVHDGEIYLPVSYMKEEVAIGDQVIIQNKAFTVQGFLRDSQMNSLLASSKRFLVSDQDYNALQSVGNVEYLIEFRLQQLEQLSTLENDYITAGLEANGPTITYPLFKTLNAISDGLMIALILLVSVLIVVISLLCIRFTLLAKMEEDYREIGVLKAIGLRVADIKKIYIAKYSVITLVGASIGVVLAYMCKDLLLENIKLYMGESENTALAIGLGMVGVGVLCIIIMGYIYLVLGRFKKIAVTEAIQFGTAQEKSISTKHFTLAANKWLPTNVFLGLKDVMTRKRLYFTMLIVLVITTFIMIVPQNLYHTISSKDFTTYMGIGNSDMRIDIQQTAEIKTKANQMVKALANDDDVQAYNVLATKTYYVQQDQQKKRIKVELGDHTLFPVTYAQGNAPKETNEIALSVMNADELNKKVGDKITLIVDDEAKPFVVSGIYSDITNGGKTAKATFTTSSEDMMWYVINVTFKANPALNAKVKEYADQFSYAKVSHIDEYIQQSYGPTIASIEKAAFIAIVVALLIAMLIVFLFIKMLTAKDRYTIAVMKSFGFTNADITKQYMSRALFVAIISVIIGTIAANTLGESIVGAVIGTFGATAFTFTIQPLSAYVLSPLMLICAVLVATIIGASYAGRIKISQYMKE
ncbi:ABC transporter permease [Lysinibacillus alkalisoli]|uniref:ABC transporter permease n=1 Tax=Lysinibacillus alkalisoli TaxID=1911548 RepID=A0A917G9Q5_9BACI|nr:ABC transporter permease [Lysinibacillus alkalisoli]GGG31896.1 ABC transporter permease [Lysinibacillus alkalisoli]